MKILARYSPCIIITALFLRLVGFPVDHYLYPICLVALVGGSILIIIGRCGPWDVIGSVMLFIFLVLILPGFLIELFSPHSAPVRQLHDKSMESTGEIVRIIIVIAALVILSALYIRFYNGWKRRGRSQTWKTTPVDRMRFSPRNRVVPDFKPGKHGHGGYDYDNLYNGDDEDDEEGD